MHLNAEHRQEVLAGEEVEAWWLGEDRGQVEEEVVHLACRCDDGYATQVFDAMHLEAVVDRLQVLRGALVPLQVPLSLVHADPRFRAS